MSCSVTRKARLQAEGQKRGLFEFAGKGTVFLDEIGELPASLQPKLLRALEERKVRRIGGLKEVDITCRVIAATNRELSLVVSEGYFRADLYYRLSGFRLQLPPLRERPGDVELLARFLRTISVASTAWRRSGLRRPRSICSSRIRGRAMCVSSRMRWKAR